jgi:hypothetical protein
MSEELRLGFGRILQDKIAPTLQFNDANSFQIEKKLPEETSRDQLWRSMIGLCSVIKDTDPAKIDQLMDFVALFAKDCTDTNVCVLFDQETQQPQASGSHGTQAAQTNPADTGAPAVAASPSGEKALGFAVYASLETFGALSSALKNRLMKSAGAQKRYVDVLQTDNAKHLSLIRDVCRMLCAKGVQSLPVFLVRAAHEADRAESIDPATVQINAPPTDAAP